MNPALLAVVGAAARPIAICLLAGALQFFQDYTTTQKLMPALIDGGYSAVKVGAAMVGIGGVVAGAQTAAAKVAIAKGSPAAPTP